MKPYDSNFTIPERSTSPKRRWLRRPLLPLGALVVLLIIAGLAFPAVGSPDSSSKLEDALNLRQVGLLCRLYAGDYDGQFPVQFTTNGVNITTYEGWPPTQNSNEAFRALFAMGYTREEKTFHTSTEYYDGRGCFLKGDNKIGTEASHFQEALAPGECSFIYFVGLNKSSDSTMPLACNIVRGSITYEPGKGWVAHDLYKELHKGRGINILRVDGIIEFKTVQSDGSILLGGLNDEQAALVKVVYPQFISPIHEPTPEEKSARALMNFIGSVIGFVLNIFKELICLILSFFQNLFH